MNLNLLAESGISNVALVLLIALIVVAVLLLVASVVAGILRIMIFFNYYVLNRQQTAAGYTGCTAAQKLLSDLGYNDIRVEKCGLFRALIFGNHYNPKKKIVYLLPSAYKRGNLTSVGLALQKVGLAIEDKRSGIIRARWGLQKFAIFGPILFIPIVLVGAILDLVIYIQTGSSFSGVGMLIAACVGLSFFIASFVLSLLTLKVEKKANRETLEILKGTDFLTPEEQVKVAKVFRLYHLMYLADFLINVLELVKLILKILLQIVLSSSKRK